MIHDPRGDGGSTTLARPIDPAGAVQARHRSLLSVSGLTVDFHGRRGAVRAVHDVTFEVAPGEILGLVGESGSGKSITALSILGLVPPPGHVVSGQAVFGGRDLLDLPEAERARLRGRRIAFISQTPRAALNPSFRVGAQLDATLRSCAPELSAAGRSTKARALLGSLGFDDPGRVAASYPHQLSGGMCQRVCIAMALAGSPDLLIADEPTTALDVAVQAQILALLRRLNRDLGLAILIVSHDLALVGAIADRVVVLYGGDVQEVGDADAVLRSPNHPYTQALLHSIPDPDAPQHRLAYIPGFPIPVAPGTEGCRFAPRCSEVFDRCRVERPALRHGAGGVRARCHLVDVSVRPS